MARQEKWLGIVALSSCIFLALMGLLWLWENHPPLCVIFALGGLILLAYEFYERSWSDQIRRAAPGVIDPLTQGTNAPFDMPDEKSAVGTLLAAIFYGSVLFGLCLVLIL